MLITKTRLLFFAFFKDADQKIGSGTGSSSGSATLLHKEQPPRIKSTFPSHILKPNNLSQLAFFKHYVLYLRTGLNEFSYST